MLPRGSVAWVLLRISHPCFGKDAIGVRVCGYSFIAWYFANESLNLCDPWKMPMKPILSPSAKALMPHNVSEENLYEAGVPVSRHVMSPNLLQPQNVETQQVYYLWVRRRHVSRIIDQ